MENSTLFHNEIETFRLVLNSSGSTIHPVLGTIPNKGILPLATQMTGTISSLNADASGGKLVIGVGTTFQGSIDNKTLVQPNDFIYDPAQFVARRVDKVLSDSRLMLTAKFPAQLSGVQLWVVRRTFHKIYAKSTGASGVPILLEQNFAIADTFLNSGAPVSYDASVANSEISFLLSL